MRWRKTYALFSQIQRRFELFSSGKGDYDALPYPQPGKLFQVFFYNLISLDLGPNCNSPSALTSLAIATHASSVGADLR